MESKCWKAGGQHAGPPHQQIVEIAGHILDSLVLSEALDDVLALGGDYCIEELDVGHRKENPSFVRLTVGAPTPEQLQAILVRLEQLGGRVPESH